MATAIFCTPSSALAADAPAELVLDQVTLRLVSDRPTPDGRLRAALLLDLAPGWKTYWLDPGDAGLPPRLDASASDNLAHVETGLPVPHRFGDASGSSTGYSQPLAFALTLQEQAKGAPSAINVKLGFGVCREVCIPVDAHLGLDVGTAPTRPADARLVAFAFDALPETSGPEAGIRTARLSPDRKSLEVEAVAPADAKVRTADLFVKGPEGWFFGKSAAPSREGRTLRFLVPIAERPKAAGEAPPTAIHAVLDLGTSAYDAKVLPVEAAGESPPGG